MSSPAPAAQVPTSVIGKKKPHPFWLGGVAATIAASITQYVSLSL